MVGLMGSSQDEVERYLRENGIATAKKIARELGKDPASVHSALTRLRKWGIADFEHPIKGKKLWSIKSSHT